ncbi:MAG: ABC transporter substrate-binding protein [Alkaliphilus sp.]
MLKKIIVLMLVLAMVLSLGLVGCQRDEEPAAVDQPEDKQEDKPAEPVADKYGGVVRIATWSSPPGVFHPHLYTDLYDSLALSPMFDSMLKMTPDLEFVPSMADKFEVSEDSKTLTFWLKEGLTWHDGKPVTTADVQYTFEMIADAGYTGPRFADIAAIEGVVEFNAGEADYISGIKIYDDLKISITTKEIYAPALADIGARAIIAKHIWSGIPVAEHAEQTEMLRNPIGSGPFKMKEFVPDQFVHLVPFEDFHEGRPYLDGFILQVANQDTSQAQLIAGELDFMDISNIVQDEIDLLEAEGIVVEKVVSRGFQYMGINNRLEMFADARVRHAFAHAINRQGIVDSLLEGNGVVANVPLAPISWAMPDASKINQYPYDSEKAIALLEEAGWEYKDGTMYRDGEPVTLTLLYPPGNKVREKSAPLIQQNLGAIGIAVELEIMEFGTLVERTFNTHEFELFLMGWGLSPDPDTTSIWHSDGAGLEGWNVVGFINDLNDELLEKGTQFLAIEDRKPIYLEWAINWNKYLPSIPLYSVIEARAYNPRLRGLQIHSYSNYFEMHKWYFAE